MTFKTSGRVRIKVYSLDGSCSGSCVFFVTPKEVTYDEPTTTTTSIKINWQAQDNATGYKIYRWDNDSSDWIYEKLVYKNEGCIFNNLTPDTTYKYGIVSYLLDNSVYPPVERESEMSVTEATTDPYNVVKSISTSAQYLTLETGKEPIWTFNGCEVSNITITASAGPLTADNRELEFSFEDENMATLVRAEKQDNGTYNLYIRGDRAGYTNLIIRTKDSVGLEKKIPIGIFDAVKIENVKGSTEFGKLTVTFDGLADESSFDGYVIRRIQGYRNVDPVYISKSGAASYAYEFSEGLVPGEKYGYRVAVYSYKDGIYHERNMQTVDNLIMPQIILITGIDIGNEAITLESGCSTDITPVIAPIDASVSDLDWLVDNEEIIKLDVLTDKNGCKYGRITGIKSGTANIIIMATDGSDVVKNIQVTVDKKEDIKDPVIDKPQDAASIGAPSIKSVVNEKGQIKLTWSKKIDAKGYVIYRKEGTSGWKKVATLSSKNLTYIDKNVKSGKVYYYTIKAYKTGAISKCSNVKKTDYLSAVTIKSVTNTVKTVKLTWKKVTGAKGYKVYRKLKGGKWKLIATIKKGTTCKNYDKKAVNGKIYYYKVCAYNGVYKSTADVTAKKIIRLASTSITKLTNSKSGQIIVKWKKSKAAGGYQIKYIYKGKSHTQNVSKNKIEKKISKLKNGTYKIYVRVYKTVSGKKYYSTWSKSKKTVHKS